jgi:hypothetical protein
MLDDKVSHDQNKWYYIILIRGPYNNKFSLYSNNRKTYHGMMRSIVESSLITHQLIDGLIATSLSSSHNKD